MPSCVFAHHGGERPESPEAGAKHMAKFRACVGGLGDALVNPGTLATQILQKVKLSKFTLT